MADPVFPLTIDDTSPVIIYSPFRDTFSAPDLTAGWNPYYSDSGFATVDSGMGSVFGTAIGNGTSMHMTSCDGAALAISWNGTSIILHGTLIPILTTSSDPNSPSYTVTLDGTATTNFLSSLSSPPSVLTASVDVLASFSGLTSGEHQIALTLRNPEENDPGGGAVLAFDRAVLEVDAGIVPSKESSSSDSLPPTTTTSTSPSSTLVAVTSTVPDDAMAFRGQWSFVEGLLPGSSASFHTSTNIGDRAQLEFNGTAIALSGLTTPSSGAYNITLDGAPPLTMSARASFTASAPTLLYFTAGLDPTVGHALEVVNVGSAGAGDGAGTLLVLGEVNVTTVEPGATSIGAVSASRGLPRGTIAALVIGVALAIIAFVIFGIFVIRRRRASRRKREMLVNPRISRAGRLSFLRPRRLAGPEAVQEKGETHDADVGAEGVLDISAQKQDGDDDDEDDDAGHRLSAADKGKGRAGSRNGRASQNSDGSFSIDLPDLTSSQGPRGHLPAFPSTPSPPTPTPSLTSPRSPRPRGPREMLGRESNRGILLSPISPSREGGLEGVDHGGYLPVAIISPLRVEFASEQERPDRRTEKYVSAGAVSLPQSLQQEFSQHEVQQQQQQREMTEEPSRPEPVFSFLDFSSSTSTSLSSGQPRSTRQSASNSNSGTSSSKSKRNTGSEHSARSQSINWASLSPDRRISLGLSMSIAGGPTTSHPSLIPNISLQPVALPPAVPPLPVPSAHLRDPSVPETEAEGPNQLFPYDAAGQLPSPTDSIPYTVSDIHFRHSVQSEFTQASDSRRTSVNRMSGLHRPPHPPLPGSAGPSSPTRPTHQREGSASESQVVPPFIVQRLLGMHPGSHQGTPFGSPTVPGFSSQGAAPSGAARPQTPQSAQQTPSTGTPAGASATTSAPPSSGTTVFGFQLGRHR